MRKPIRSFVICILPLALSTLTFVSCGASSDEPSNQMKGDGKSRSIEISSAEGDVSRQSNLFAWNLLEECMSQSEDNVLLSPISANLCLSMLANATANDTRSQILDALGFSNEDMGYVNSLNSKLAKQICGLDERVTLSIANSFWYDKGINPKSDFIKDIEDNYCVESHVINPATFSNDVNRWCKDKTKGLIPRILEDGDLYAFAFLNAIYFKGYWNGDFKFDKKSTKKDVFHNIDGSKTRVDFMHNKRTYYSMSTGNWRAMQIPFGGGGFQFTVILPNEERTIEDCIKSIKENEPATYKFANSASLDIKLPKFKIKQEQDLRKTLNSMGVVDVFTEFRADFSNMTDNDMYVDLAKQSVSFELDEEGAEAAAVTVIGGYVATSVPQEVTYEPFYVDRPFIFLISESSTGAILFLGSIKRF